MAKEKIDKEELEEDIEEIEEDEKEVEQKEKSGTKKEIPSNKATIAFMKSIENYLTDYAATDEQFSEKMKNPKKTLDQCCGYILEQVKKSQRFGFDDGEIFAMARHYYNEEEVEGKSAAAYSCKIITNEHIDLSPEEIEQAKRNALLSIQNEERERLLKENEKEEKKAAIIKKKKQDKIIETGVEQIDLFAALQ